MLRYLNFLDYDFNNQEDDSSTKPTLHLQARMYHMGEKYGINSLKIFAMDKLRRRFETHCSFPLAPSPLTREDPLVAIKVVVRMAARWETCLRGIANPKDLLEMERLQPSRRVKRVSCSITAKCTRAH